MGAAVRAADVVVVVSGTDGVLPSVVAGLVEAPVIAVPTSVGYGASLQVLSPCMSTWKRTPLQPVYFHSMCATVTQNAA